MATAVVQSTDRGKPEVRSPFLLPGLHINWADPWELVPVILFILSLVATALILIFAPDSAKLALLIPVGLVMGLTVVVRPELALIMSIAYTPFESDQFRPLPFLPDSMSVPKILGALILVVFFFNIIVRRRKFRMFDDPQDFAVLLLASVFLLSGVTSVFPGKTYTSASRMIRMLIYYFAVKNLLSSDFVVRSSMWAMVVSGGIAGLWGINDYLSQNAVMIHDVRTGGVYMDPNDYAALAVVVILIAIHLLEITPQRIWKALIIFCMVASGFSLLVSASRMGLMALALTVGIYIWRHPRRNLLLVLCISALVISFPMWPDSIKARFGAGGDTLGDSTYTDVTEHSTERRASYLVFGSGIIVEHPVLGAGYGTFARLYPRSEFARFDNPLTDDQRYRLAHNAYLEIAVGTGFVGLTAFVLCLSVALYYLHQCTRWSRRGTVFWAASSGFELGLLSLMFCNAFLSIEHFNYTWVSVAMSSVLALRMRQEKMALVLAAPTPTQSEEA